nr:uncharacterized protein C22orf15 homolog isoform X19 [Pongo abelii]
MFCRTQKTNTWESPHMGEKSPHMGDGWRVLQGSLSNRSGCSVLVNTSCRLVNLTAHLRQKAGLPPDATIALLAEDGNLVSLEEDLKEGASRAQTMGNSLLKERAIYVLVRIISKRERTWPLLAMSPYWRTWMTITQSWQATTGGSVWALGVAAMSKAPLQGPERALIKGMDCTL